MFITNTMRVLKWLRQVREVAMKFNRTILLVGRASSEVPLWGPGFVLDSIAIVYCLHSRVVYFFFSDSKRKHWFVCVFARTPCIILVGVVGYKLWSPEYTPLAARGKRNATTAN